MTKRYLKPETHVADFFPDARLCLTSTLPGSASDYIVDPEDIFDD